MFLPSPFSIVRPEPASQRPDTDSFSAQFSHDHLAAEAGALPIRDVFHRQVKCQAGAVINRKSHS